MIKALTTILVTVLPVLVFAASEGEHHGPAHLTDHDVQKIIYQAINVGAILIGLIYFLRKPTKEFFQQRRKDYLAAAQKSQDLQRAAEQERANIQAQLTKLENTADESISRARAEAADLKATLINEAKLLSERLRTEAQNTATIEVAKAKMALKEQTIEEAAQLAQKQVASSVSADDHARLNKEFIKNIETVQP